MTRDDLLELAFRSVSPRTTATFEQFRAAVDGWDVVPVVVRGQAAGAVLIDGAELHACILPAFFGRWLTRAVLRETLQRVLAEHGHALTRVASGNAAGHAFVTRLGFIKISDADGVATYRLEAQHGH